MRWGFGRYLVCPSCDGSLETRVEEQVGDRIRSGRLVCECGTTYPIRDYVPRFAGTDRYVDTFSFQWRKHKVTQLDRDTRRESEETFRL